MTSTQLAARYPLRPMEDAPRDGTEILLFVDEEDRNPRFGTWSTDREKWDCPGELQYISSKSFLGWLPVPTYDFEARIAELEGEVARLQSVIDDQKRHLAHYFHLRGLDDERLLSLRSDLARMKERKP